MAKCDCYYQHGTKFLCYGTKEMEECSCGGNESKCNFYPEKRKPNMANEKQQLIDVLKQYHDNRFTPQVYEHSIFGKAALLLERSEEVVRCKDCIWFDSEDELPDVFRSEQYCYCTEANTYVPINHFCSFGERRTDA